MEHTGINMASVKKQNRSSIIKYINQVGPVSRKDIANSTGLTPASVTQITNSLIEDGILYELGASDEKISVGRKKILLGINYDYAYVISVNIESEITVIAVSNLCGDIEILTAVETNRKISPKEFLVSLADSIKNMICQCKPEIIKKTRGVSVGIPGIVDRDRGRSIHAYGIWDEPVDVCNILKGELGFKCYIENNVHAFSLATLYFGEGRKDDNLHIIKWGPGVGSSILIGGKVYEGRGGKAAELGHCIVEKDGRRCNCGRRGCLETKISFNALNEVVYFGRDDFEEAYINSAGIKRRNLDEAIDLFARTLINSMTIIAPNRIILSGFMFKGKAVRKKLIDACKYYDPTIGSEQIRYSTISDKESYIGPVAAFINLKI